MHSSATMDLIDNEDNRKRLADQKAHRRKSQLKAEKLAEDQQVINAGRGPRKAKQQAQANAVWLTDRGTRKRVLSRSPSPPAKKKIQAITKTAARAPAKSSTGRGSKAKEIKASNNSQKTGHRARTLSYVDESEDESENGSMSDENNVMDSEKDDNEDSSDDELEGDEEFSDGNLQRQMDEEVPRIGAAKNLFDDDEGVEFVKSRHRSSSPMDYPLTGSSLKTPQNAATKIGKSSSMKHKTREPNSGADDDSSSNSEDSDSSLPATIIPDRLLTSKQPRKRTKGALSKRDVALASERTSSVISNKQQKLAGHRSASTPSRRPSKKLDDSDNQSNESNIDNSDHSDTLPRDEKEWARVARLVTKRGNSGLLVQNRFITALIHECIEIVIKRVHLDDPWAEHHNWAPYRQEVLIHAVKKLMKLDNTFSPLLSRIQLDPEFRSRIGKWFMDRIAGCRHAMIASARVEICGYRLGKGDKCIERVHLLVQDDAYCHPGSFITMDAGRKMAYVSESTPTKDLKFLHPVIIDTIIGAFFSTSTSSGWKYRDMYTTSLPDRPEHQEPEVPMAMVALAATAVYTAIWEMREGVVPRAAKHAKKAGAKGLPVQDQFSGNTVLGVYKGHMDHLMTLKEYGKVTYHKLMAKIYEHIRSNDSAMPGRPDGKLTCAPLAGVDRSFLEN